MGINFHGVAEGETFKHGMGSFWHWVFFGRHVAAWFKGEDSLRPLLGFCKTGCWSSWQEGHQDRAGGNVELAATILM